ncbi:MAG: hypothetical protein V1891_04870 [bacterium]
MVLKDPKEILPVRHSFSEGGEEMKKLDEENGEIFKNIKGRVAKIFQKL